MTKRVVHITPVYPPYAGGIGVVAQSMAEGLSARNWDVGVITPEVSNSTHPPLKIRGGAGGVMTARVTYLRPWLRRGNAAVVPQLRTLEGYDIVHLHYPFFGGTEWLLFNKPIKQKRTKLILQYHHDADAHGLKGAIFKLYDKIVLPRLIHQADKVVVSSMDYARHSQVAKFISDKFVVIPLGVDIERFHPSPERHSGAQRSAAIESTTVRSSGDPIASLQDDKPFTILFVGSLDRAHWFKGLGVLLKALMRVKEQFSQYHDRGMQRKEMMRQWRLLVVGDGDLRPQYEQHARDLGLSTAVIAHDAKQSPRDRHGPTTVEPRDDVDVVFLGKVSHELLPHYYNIADCFVFPSVSRAEAFGLVVLEAMASGLPVIVSDLPGVRTLIGALDSVRALQCNAPTIGGYCNTPLQTGGSPPNNVGDAYMRPPHGSHMCDPYNVKMGENEREVVQCGLTFPVNNPHALAQRIELLINNQLLRRRMGENARKKVLERYTIGKTIDHIEQLYARLTH